MIINLWIHFKKTCFKWTKLDLELKELNKKCSDIRKKKEILQSRIDLL